LIEFKICKAKESDFQSGLRGFFKYRNLGIEAATFGNLGANVIKSVPGKKSKGDWHYHKLEFQMVYILKGWVTFEYEGKGTFTLQKGDTVCQPPKIRHREIEHSDDLELIEITSPAIFDTFSV
tara:strand:+ start:111 stop:479 length:369 start_codon:yes stop_codon:yes gene_type:complete